MKEEKAYLNSNLSVEERVEDLFSKMTLEEKIGQLKARIFPLGRMFFEFSEGLSEDQMRGIKKIYLSLVFEGGDIWLPLSANYWRKHWKEVVVEGERYGIGQLSTALRPFSPRESTELANKMQKFIVEKTRLGIPVMIHEECLHGCVAKGSTIFPQAIALASTWDPDLMREVATAIGKETRARGIHHGLSPTINIARDPRCGRTEESYGEDSYLTLIMAISFVEGLQSQKVVATPKHFVANFVGDGGRDSNEIHFSKRILKEIYFPAFKACIQKANALSLMPAYNSIDGVPCSSNKELLTDILRREWGFKGFVVSDYGSVLDIYTKHKVAETKAEAAKKALEAGLDVELPESDCFEELLNLVKEEKLSEEVINEATRRILRVKFWLGLFDDPYVSPEYAEEICDCEEHRRLSLRAARKATVLLKNEGILPLSKNLKSIAVIGPNANKIRLGGYSGHGVKVVTPLEGIKNKVSEDMQVYFAEGCKLTGNSKEGFGKAINAAKKSSVAILFVGNSAPKTEGEQRDRCNLDLPGMQEDLIKEICDIGTSVVVVLINGSAITMRKWIDNVEGLIEAWYPGEEGGNAIADVLFGDYNPGGKLPITFPKTIGQLPLYYNHKPTGRADDYVDMRGKQAMFSFGYGLSYTEFEYSNLKINPEKINPEGKVNISIEVENVGRYKGDEVVQLYIHDAVATIARPVKELKGFKRVTLEPGERKTVDFTLTSEDLASYDIDMNLGVEPGIFEVMIGSSSEDIRLEGSFEVK
ncbi:glycoside hydrolase family 3 C-terminal domain-containing protein [Candidatus Aerophobetes bacterium]|nr:glycoside hydrolase family 3 C-terminal domain-containing protein [Candidatus Aerophobetes bacterium]